MIFLRDFVHTIHQYGMDIFRQKEDDNVIINEKEYKEYSNIIRNTIVSFYNKFYQPQYKEFIEDMIHDILVLIDKSKLSPVVEDNYKIISGFTKIYLKTNYQKYFDNNTVLISSFDFDDEEDEINQFHTHILKQVYSEFVDNFLTDNDNNNEIMYDNRLTIINKIINFVPDKYVSQKTLEIVKQMVIIYIINLDELNDIKFTHIFSLKNNNMLILDIMIHLYNENNENNESKLFSLYNKLDTNMQLVTYTEIVELIKKNLKCMNTKTGWDGNTYRAFTYLSKIF